MFKSWLTSSSKLCNSDGKAGKSEIEKHAAGAKHKKLIESAKHTRSVFDMPSVSGEKCAEKTSDRS